MRATKCSLSITGLLALFFTSAAIVSLATSLQAADQHHTLVAGDAVKWGPAPPSLPPGAQAAVLLGNPAQEGAFVLRLKFPTGFTVPPHRHSKDELVTVISGKFAIAAGEKLDRTKAKSLPPGSFVHLPAGMAHYAWADGEAIVQINGMGPFDVTYIDPKDDPRK
jgi:quercetin dioxygenase-like cupin family protein